MALRLGLVGVRLLLPVSCTLLALTVSGASGIRPDAVARLQGEAAMAQARAAGIDIGAAIETVSHQFRSGDGRLAADDRVYRVELDARRTM